MPLPSDIEEALLKFMAEYEISREEALRVILRDWLTGHGYLKADE